MKRRTIIAAGSIALLLLVVAGFLILHPSTAELRARALSTETDDRIIGSREADTVLIAYLDIACDTCQGLYGAMRTIGLESPSDIAIAIRHYPTDAIHPNAQAAARAYEAAALQDAAFPMLDLLFEEQEAWIQATDTEPIFTSYAERLSLDVERFRKDMDSSKVSRRIASDFKTAQILGVRRAPTIFLNGTEIPEQRTYAEFRRMVLDAVYD